MRSLIFLILLLAAPSLWASGSRNQDADVIKSSDHTKTLTLPAVVGATGTNMVTNGAGLMTWENRFPVNIVGGHNPDGEVGDTSSWTNSGSGTLTSTTTAANVGFGTYAISWDAAAASDTLTSFAGTLTSGLFGANCLLEFYYKGFDTNITAQVYDGTSVLTSVVLSAQTGFVKQQLNFVCPSSGTIQLRLLAAANAAIGFVDNLYIGAASNLTSASSTVFVGSAYFATTASCTWTRNNTALGAFGTTAACPGPTVDLNPGPGSIQTTDSDLPRVTVNNLPPGYYEVTFSGIASGSTNFTGAQLGINDGSATANLQGSFHGTNSGNGIAYVRAYFNYTTTANRSFELYAAATTGTVTVDNSVGVNRLSMTIVRYPSATDVAFKPDVSPSSWSGYHDTTCTWTRANTAYGDFTDDASCALVERLNRNFGTVSTSGSVSPTITFTPQKAGRYWVCAITQANVGAAATMALQLTDGTNIISESSQNESGTSLFYPFTLCGIVNAPSTSAVTLKIQGKSSTGTLTMGPNTAGLATINWSIFALDQSLPAPLLANSLVSPSTGVLKVMSAHITGNATTPVITRQDGSWLSSIARNGAGDYTLTLVTGVCSTIPNCSTSCAPQSNVPCETCLDGTATLTTRSTTTIRFVNLLNQSPSDTGQIDFFCTCQP